jgi:glutamyl-tRNA synthetase
MIDKPVRVRFAPSPTGHPHIGGVRSALFNWLYARHCGGTFILRIEDTDVARTVPGSIDSICNGLHWLGLQWDEGPQVGGKYGPYVQSERLPLYHKIAKQLVEQGDAYYCFCTPQRLEAMRAAQTAAKRDPGYDRTCRTLSRAECEARIAAGEKAVVRFKSPGTGKTEFIDLIRGKLTFDNSTLDDFVLLKSDGYPTYHLANVIDDHAMEISHIMRAEEWLPSVPRHVLLYHALGYEVPLMAHLPDVLGTDRSKLSKRHGAVGIMEYYDIGYLPDALVNFLSLLGWSLDGKTEIMKREDIVKSFSIERVSATAAIFDKNKLDWMNGVYIRALTLDRFFAAAEPYLMKDTLVGAAVIKDPAYVKRTLPLVQERVKVLSELPDLIKFFFEDRLEYDPKLLISKGMDKAMTLNALEKSRAKLGAIPVFANEPLEKEFRPLAESLGLKAGQLFGSLRTATTGREISPPLFATMEVLGRERTLERVQAAIDKLQNVVG